MGADAAPTIDPPPVGIADPDEMARVVGRCLMHCRRRAGRAAWSRADGTDWEQVAVLAAWHLIGRYRPRFPGDMPSPPIVARFCSGALSQLTMTDRRRSATSTPPTFSGHPHPGLADPNAHEPWVWAAIHEESKASD